MSNIINIEKPKSIFSSKKHKLSKKMRLVFIVLLVILLIGVILGGVYFYLLTNGKINQAKTPEQNVTKIIEESTTSGDVKASQDKLQDLADNETNIDDKLTYMYASVDLYYNSGDYENGLKAAKEVEDLKKTALSASVLAYGYMKSEDYKNAAKYYGIAADRSEKVTDNTLNMPYNDYMNLKKEAEALIK